MENKAFGGPATAADEGDPRESAERRDSEGTVLRDYSQGRSSAGCQRRWTGQDSR